MRVGGRKEGGCQKHAIVIWKEHLVLCSTHVLGRERNVLFWPPAAPSPLSLLCMTQHPEFTLVVDYVPRKSGNETSVSSTLLWQECMLLAQSMGLPIHFGI